MTPNVVGGRQATIFRQVVLKGVGVHSGAPVSLILHPAEANSGISFTVQSSNGEGARIPADFRAITNVMLCTEIGGEDGTTVATVEHLLAALRGLGIDNVEIEIDGNEVPIMDGSAQPFVDAIEEVGIQILNEPRRFIRVLKPVVVEEGDSIVSLEPYDGFRLDVEIDFDSPIIGRQRWQGEVTPRVFQKELARARTFGFMKDVEHLWKLGRALGSSLENTIALDEHRIINPEGLRFSDEFVRHKALDALGDLTLAGAPILGAFRSYRGGHRLNSMILHALYEDRNAWTLVEAVERPRYREVGQELGWGWGLAMPAFAADRS